MKKVLAILLLSFLCAFLMISCQKADDENSGANSDNVTAPEAEKEIDNNVIYSPDVDLKIIYNPGCANVDYINTLFYGVAINAKSATVSTDVAPEAEHEIVVGKIYASCVRAGNYGIHKIEFSTHTHMV